MASDGSNRRRASALLETEKSLTPCPLAAPLPFCSQHYGWFSSRHYDNLVSPWGKSGGDSPCLGGCLSLACFLGVWHSVGRLTLGWAFDNQASDPLTLKSLSARYSFQGPALGSGLIEDTFSKRSKTSNPLRWEQYSARQRKRWSIVGAPTSQTVALVWLYFARREGAWRSKRQRMVRWGTTEDLCQ